MNYPLPHMDVILLAVGALMMLALLVLVFLAARRDGGTGGVASAKALRLLGTAAVRRSFGRAKKLIERNLATRAERYNLSWTMLLNESQGAPLPLPASGLQSALSEEAGMRAAAQGLDWQFFDQGVVIQLRSAYLGGADTDGVWDDLIGHCRKYRPQRPLDCIVLAIPATQLLDTTPEGQRQLQARAKSLHRRLWLAQNRLALRFPIHLVVSECETIPGFASFAAALPDAIQRSILGWASPHELAAPYRPQWIDHAVEQVSGAIADNCAELCALESGDSDSSAYFLVASEVERLRGGLTLFCDELMHPSAYHESFLLRGIYLTGDCGDAAVLRATAAAGAEQGDAVAVPTHAMPAFLRDIFERKIFAEVGLVRASAQRLRRPAVKRASWALLYLVPVLWAAGLVFATVTLADQGVHLKQIIYDRADAGNSARTGADMSSLNRFAVLGGAPFRSVFMPGSIFDPMQKDLEVQLQYRFGIAAVVELHDAAKKRLDELTKAPVPDATEEVKDPENCDVASGAARPAAGLNLASMPQYQVLRTYLADLAPFADAMAALERLEPPDPATVDARKPAPEGRDLALAVRLLFHYRLADQSGDRSAVLNRMAQLYRAAARRGARARERTSLPTFAVLQDSARCALRRHGITLHQQLFDHNPLLASQTAIAGAITGLQDGTQSNAGLPEQLQRWEALRSALDKQQQLLFQGQGDWMAQEQMQLGAAHATLLKLIGENKLLGPDAQQDFDDRARERFTAFKSNWQAAGQTDSAATLTWSVENRIWTATPERKALRDAVTALMSQPYLKGGAPLPYPVVASDAAIVWDKGELERVASLIDARKAFRSGTLIVLPTSLQQSAGALVDLALFSAAQGALAQGMRLVGPELPSGATDADRVRVLALRESMESIGESGALVPLNAALSADAVNRLKRLDQLRGAAALYVPADPGFDHWTGTAGPLQDAFGGGDGTGVLAYVEQQKEFIETLVRQGDGVVKFLGSRVAAVGADDLLLVHRWQRQAVDQQLYNRKSPLSSRLALETFIIEESATLDGANCIDKLAGRKAGAGTDGYAVQLQQLKSALLARCRVLAGGESERSWQKFALAYNSDLARRPPFAAAGAGAVPDAMPAERDAVAAVLRDYDLAHAASVVAARDRGQPGARAAVKAADQEFGRVRELLAPLYPLDDSQPAALDLSIDFRVNKALEQRANTIIDWSLAVGPATLRQGEPVRTLRWEPGMPVVLSLRLARDGVLAPDPGADARRPNMTVVERTVSFRFGDPWALFTFVQSFRVPDPAGEDGRAPLLRVEFPVVATGTPVPAAAPATVQLFLRLRVRAPGKQTSLPWPVAFHEQLPLWTQPAKNPL